MATISELDATARSVAFVYISNGGRHSILELDSEQLKELSDAIFEQRHKESQARLVKRIQDDDPNAPQPVDVDSKLSEGEARTVAKFQALFG